MRAFEEYIVEFYEIRYIIVIEMILRGGVLMPNIKPISDLRNYGEVLQDVSVGAPVFLTKNGHGRYAILDIHEYEKLCAAMKLMSELEYGARLGEEKGWLKVSDVKAHFRAKENE